MLASALLSAVPDNSASRKRNTDENVLSFQTTSADAKFIREELCTSTSRYLNSAQCLRKPAEVTDKLRKAHGRLLHYCRDSMKGGIARMLKEDDVRETIVSNLARQTEERKQGRNENEDQDDEIVSR
mgnify:CR=1 FL=1